MWLISIYYIVTTHKSTRYYESVPIRRCFSMYSIRGGMVVPRYAMATYLSNQAVSPLASGCATLR